MTLLLYGVTATILIWLIGRWITPVTVRAAVLLVLLPLVFTGKAMIGDRVYGPIDHPYQWEPLLAMRENHGVGPAHNFFLTDVYSQMFPWRRAVQLSLAEGRWPLWNPWILSGHPLAGAAQPAAYSPFTLLACVLPAATSFTFTAAMAFFLAGTTAFLFARELNCSEEASFITAVGFMYSTVVALYILWPLGFSWALFPMVMLAARRVVDRPGLNAAALLATALALQLLAGHPETVLHSVVLGSVYGLFEVIRRRALWRPLLTAIAGGSLALLLCAVYVLPLLEALPQSAEYEYKREVWSGQPRGAAWPCLWRAAAASVLPHLFGRQWAMTSCGGPSGETAAVGSVLLSLAIFALWQRRCAVTRFFALAALVCVAASVDWKPVTSVMKSLPLLDITHNNRLAFAAVFFMAVLAGIGADVSSERPRRAAICAFAVLIAIAFGTFFTRDLVTTLPEWGRYRTVAELAGPVAVVAVLLGSRRQWIVAAITAILLLQRALSDAGAIRSWPARAAYPPVPLLKVIPHGSQPFRIAGQGLTMIPATGVFYGLEDARGYEALTFAPLGATYRLWSQHQIVWFNRVDDLTRPFLSFLNVRYAIALSDAVVPAGWRKIGADRGSALLENQRVIPRVFVPARVVLGPQEGDSFRQHGPTIRAMEQADDFRRQAWIRADVTPHVRDNGPGAVRIRRYRAGEYDLDADMAGNGWIVISDSAWKGWRAYIDGRRVKMHRANVAFNSVFVPKGRHRVRVVYWPESFVIGRAISGVTLLIAAIALVVRVRR